MIQNDVRGRKTQSGGLFFIRIKVTISYQKVQNLSVNWFDKMKIILIFTIAIATASKLGNIRRRSFLKHHQNKKEIIRRNEHSTELLTQYKAMKGKMAKVPCQGFQDYQRFPYRVSYNKYFTKYVSKLAKTYN